MAKHAVQFGAGNIGRGFLGQLFFESGYHTTFVEALDPVVDALNARGSYPLRIVGDEVAELEIGHVAAVRASKVEAAARVLAQADIAATAVGVNVLPKVAPTIARAVELRFAQGNAPAPLNIIVCENLLHAGPFLREQVRTHLANMWHHALDVHVGFVEASIGRMVPVMTEAQRAEDPLLVCVEPYCTLPVDAQAFRGPIPSIAHMVPSGNFQAYVERKLFVHNAGHAATAYLGHLKGYPFIWEAIADPAVRGAVHAAMDESCRGLAARHGVDAAELAAHRDDLIHRFANKALGDQIERVARDPLRKLSPQDRLIGAAQMCFAHGVEPEALAFAAAAAIRYDHRADAAARALQKRLREDGLDAVLGTVCGVAAESPLAALIHRGTDRLRREGWIT